MTKATSVRRRTTVEPDVTRPAVAPIDDEGTDFERCYREHSGRVHKLAQRLCGPRLAADVTQEVFLSLWRHPQRFDPARGSMRSLLLTATHHKAVDLIRSESARDLRERRSAPPETALVDVEARVLENERASRIAQAVHALPKLQRDAVTTVFYGQHTYREAAVVLNQPVGTTKGRIRAALWQLRESSYESNLTESSHF
jgi:RNA polymerase sigma-70 factor, ECF subfamily